MKHLIKIATFYTLFLCSSAYSQRIFFKKEVYIPEYNLYIHSFDTADSSIHTNVFNEKSEFFKIYNYSKSMNTFRFTFQDSKTNTLTKGIYRILTKKTYRRTSIGVTVSTKPKRHLVYTNYQRAQLL